MTTTGPSVTYCDLHHIGRLSFSRSQRKGKKLILDFKKDLRQRAFWEGFGKYWHLPWSFDLLLEQRLRDESWEQNGGPVNQDLQKEKKGAKPNFISVYFLLTVSRDVSGLKPLVTVEGNFEEKSTTYKSLSGEPQKLDVHTFCTKNTFFLDFQ